MQNVFIPKSFLKLRLLHGCLHEVLLMILATPSCHQSYKLGGDVDLKTTLCNVISTLVIVYSESSTTVRTEFIQRSIFFKDAFIGANIFLYHILLMLAILFYFSPPNVPHTFEENAEYIQADYVSLSSRYLAFKIHS